MGTEADEKRTILVVGATGQQGRAVLDQLFEEDFTLRGLTRTPDSEAAGELAARGVDMVQGDLSDPPSLTRALEGVWGVFAVFTMQEAGPEGEAEQGKTLARLARRSGVQRFVYSSVAAANLKTGIPHFESKWEIERAVRGLEFPSYSILRPVMFMEVLTSPMSLQEDLLTLPLNPKTVLQVVAVEDIGRVGARLFTRADAFNGTELELAGDALTLPQAAAALSKARGRPVRFVPGSLEAVRAMSEDLALMFEWFDRRGFQVDIAETSRKWGLQPTTFAAWAEAQSRPAAGA